MSATNLPLVSILIPCYNAESWIEETLQSVLAQTYSAIEIIVVDDGSNDRSNELLQAFVARQQIKLIRQENRGQAAAFNHALQYARGQFIQFLDADDLLHKEKIAIQVNTLDGKLDSIASCEWARFSDAQANAEFNADPTWADMSPMQWLNFAWHDGGGMLFPALWLIPRRVIDAAGPWDETLSVNVDGEYFVRVLLQVQNVLFAKNARCFYRSGVLGSMSGRRTSEAWISYFNSIEKIQSHLRAQKNENLRRGLSFVWQRFAYAAFPYQAQLAECALERSSELSKAELAIEGGWRFRALARLIGWRRARQLQVWSGRY